jgi:hypothetical protein
MSVDMHPGRVPLKEEGTLSCHLALHEVDRGVHRLVVDCLHPLFGKRARVLDLLLTDLAPPRVDGRIVGVRGK